MVCIYKPVRQVHYMSGTMNNSLIGLPVVYNPIIQAELLYADVIWCPAPVVCTYKPLRQNRYMSTTVNDVTHGRMLAVYNPAKQAELIYVANMW